MMVSVLALDLGTRTGWALLEAGRLESGVEAFDIRRGESPGLRYLRFGRWLQALTYPSFQVSGGLIVYEAPHHRGGAATEIAVGMSTRVQEFCAQHRIEHVAVHSGTLKRWTCGKGNADKTAMLEAVARRWKRVDTDDEADAVALLYYALAEFVSR